MSQQPQPKGEVDVEALRRKLGQEAYDQMIRCMEADLKAAGHMPPMQETAYTKRQPWPTATRTHWKQDAAYMRFHARLLSERWTFEQTRDASWLAAKIAFSETDAEALTKQHKADWSELVAHWLKCQDKSAAVGKAKDDDKSSMDKSAPAYCALAYYFATLPWPAVINVDELKRMLSRDHCMIINAIHSYEYDTPLKLPASLGYGGKMEHAYAGGGPAFPSDWRAWRDELFNAACWSLGYSVYEWSSGLAHVCMFC